MRKQIDRLPNGQGLFEPGEALVVLGTIGKRGARLALEKKIDVLSARFSAAYRRRMRERAEEKLEPLSGLLAGAQVTEWEPVEEGGILAALWNLSGAYGRGISFSLPKIPAAQEIIEICELLDLNPYRLWSGECVVAVTRDGTALLGAAGARGIPCAVIGRVEEGIARNIYGLGTTGYLERPQPDECYKI